MAALTSRSPSFSRDNFSLYLLPALWFLGIMAPKVIGRSMYKKAKGGHEEDVVNPRTFGETVSKDSSIDDATRRRILRCEGALTNHHENFPIFLGAVVAGNAAGLSPKLLNGLTLGYMASRAAHLAVYIWHDTVSKAFLRPVTYFAGVGMWITLLVKAGQKFGKAALDR